MQVAINVWNHFKVSSKLPASESGCVVGEESAEKVAGLHPIWRLSFLCSVSYVALLAPSATV